MVTLDENPFFQLNRKELELLQRFRERTVVTITPAKAILRYRDEIAKLACIVRNPGLHLACHANQHGLAPILNARRNNCDNAP